VENLVGGETKGSGIWSHQFTELHVIKESQEQMKFDYLHLFMDRNLALKFAEDKEREVMEFCY